MNFWLCVDENLVEGSDEDYNYGMRKELDREFHISHGLTPMEESVFKYVIEGIISSMFYNRYDFLCVAYIPIRRDDLYAIQASRPQIDEGINVEIVIHDDSYEGIRCFRIFQIKNQSIKETLRLFHEVLVEYKRPSLAGWKDVTDIVRYKE